MKHFFYIIKTFYTHIYQKLGFFLWKISSDYCLLANCKTQCANVHLKTTITNRFYRKSIEIDTNFIC